MADKLVGSIVKMGVGGLDFPVKGDANITIKLTGVKKEGIATSSGVTIKKTLEVPTAEGVTASMNIADADEMRKISEGLQDIGISITLADGSKADTIGQISFEDYSNMDGETNITVIPNKVVNPWVVSAAPPPA